MVKIYEFPSGELIHESAGNRLSNFSKKIGARLVSVEVTIPSAEDLYADAVMKGVAEGEALNSPDAVAADLPKLKAASLQAIKQLDPVQQEAAHNEIMETLAQRALTKEEQ